MGTAAISHLRYDLNKYALSLRKTATLASTFFIESPLVRFEYLQEIENTINDITHRFNSSYDINEKTRLINELKMESETARKEYQLFRQGNYDKYITTDIFEEHGLIKYVNLSFDIVASVGQVVGGVGALKFGKVVHSNRIKGIGVTLVAHGANNFYESLSPLFFNEYDSGPIRELYRVIAKKMGGDINSADYAYSIVDFSITAYGGYSGMKIVPKYNRLIRPSLGNRPGTGRLFHYTSVDFKNKFSLKPTPLKIIQISSTVKKFKVTFYDEKYKF
ncbi:DUF4225 domain-containing protein, partial [Escherichia coli]|nr:DUF4225 domain-containing protein [Escherichia coli]EJH8444976.1 DUF4225 domain-containing protein [Escherichia coli]